MTDCLAYAWVPHGAKQMEAVQAEAESGRDILHNFMFVRRNNWMGFFFLLFWYLDSELQGKKYHPELIAVASIDLDSFEWEHICNYPNPPNEIGISEIEND